MKHENPLAGVSEDHIGGEIETIIPPTDDTLAAAERSELEQCEEIISDGLAHFMAVGNALVKIRDARLYRAEFATFEDYCRERWTISRPRAYELMGASETIGELSAIADTSSIANEAQARELRRIAQAEGIQQAAEVLASIEDGSVTARAIRAAALEGLHSRQLAAALRFHEIDAIDPALELVPWPSEWDFEMLRESVTTLGWESSLPSVMVVTEDDGTRTLLDGRSRLLVGTELKSPAPVEIIPDPGDRLDFVMDMNVCRVHLTTGQKAMAYVQFFEYDTPKAAEKDRAGDASAVRDWWIRAFQHAANVCRRHLTPDQAEALRTLAGFNRLTPEQLDGVVKGHELTSPRQAS